MDELIQVRYDHKRRCGWRKPGGLYLVSQGPLGSCGKLPIKLNSCPCCGAGIKACRGWTWVDGDALTKPYPCAHEKKGGCRTCPLGVGIGRAGLLWVGSVFYKTPEEFSREAKFQGLSRRISRIPRGFDVGETWVLVAHRQAVVEVCEECKGSGGTFGKPESCEACDGTGLVRTHGIFGVFRPTAVEYVVTGKESHEDLRDLVYRGITPVRVERYEGDELLRSQ